MEMHCTRTCCMLTYFLCGVATHNAAILYSLCFSFLWNINLRL